MFGLAFWACCWFLHLFQKISFIENLSIMRQILLDFTHVPKHHPARFLKAFRLNKLYSQISKIREIALIVHMSKIIKTVLNKRHWFGITTIYLYIVRIMTCPFSVVMMNGDMVPLLCVQAISFRMIVGHFLFPCFFDPRFQTLHIETRHFVGEKYTTNPKEFLFTLLLHSEGWTTQ